MTKLAQLRLDELLKLVRKIAFSPHSGLAPSTRSALQFAFNTYEVAAKMGKRGKPPGPLEPPATLYDHVLEDPFKG
jgi:hypothetical protein